MKSNCGFQFFISVKWTGFLLLFFAGLLFWSPAAAEELKKEERLQFVQTILREASAEITNLPDDNFPSHGPAWIANHKVRLLKEVAKGQGKVIDREGLRVTATRAVRLSQANDLLLLPLSVIGTAQIKAGFVEDAVITAEGALESLRLHITRHGMDGDLPEISQTFLRAGKIEKALETAHMIVDTRSRAIALQNIGFQQAKNGHEAKAKEILTQSQQLITNLEDPGAKAWYVVRRAKDQFELKRRAKAAVELAQAKMLAQGVTDHDRRDRLLLEIAQLEHKWGMFENFEESLKKVVHAIDLTSDVSFRVAQYADFARQLNESGHKAQAASLLMRARQDVLLDKDPSSKVMSYLFLAEGEWELGHSERTTELVKLVVDAINEIEEPRHIGSSLFGHLFHTQVLDLITPQDLKRIQRKVERISRDDNQKTTRMDVWALAILQAQHGEFEQSMETIRQTQGAPSFRGFPIQQLGKALVKVKGIEQAMIWAKGSPSQVERIHAHVGIAEGVLDEWEIQEP